MSTWLDGYPNLVKFFDFADDTKQLMLDLTPLATGVTETWKTFSISGSIYPTGANTEGNLGDLLVSGGGVGAINNWTALSALNLLTGSLTAGRVQIATGTNTLADDADLTFDTGLKRLATKLLAVANYVTIGGASGATTDIPLSVTGVTSQTGDLQQWLTISGLRSRVDASGGLNYAKKNLTAQTADIVTQGIATSAAAGFYTIDAVLETTSADATAGVATVTFAWTDDAGATTDATLTQALGPTVGRARIHIPLYLASGNITYAVAHTGIFGTAQYALRIRLSYLGS